MNKKSILLIALISAILCACENTSQPAIEKQTIAMNDSSNAPIENATEIAVQESKTVYKSAPYELLNGGTATISVDNTDDKLVANIILKFDGTQKDLEAAVTRQVIASSYGFNSVNLTLKSGPEEEYIYLYDLVNSFSIQESASAEKYGDFLAAYGNDTSVDDATQQKIDSFLQDAKDYLNIIE